MIRSVEQIMFEANISTPNANVSLEERTQAVSKILQWLEKHHNIYLRAYLKPRNDDNPLNTLNEMQGWIHSVQHNFLNAPEIRVVAGLKVLIDQLALAIEQQLATITVNHILALKITSNLIQSLPKEEFEMVHRSARYIARKVVFEEYPLADFLKYIESLIKYAAPNETAVLNATSGYIAELDIRLMLG